MVERLRALTSGLFGVDLICAETGFGRACTDLHIDACVQVGVPLVVFHHDPPQARWASALRAAGIRVWMQASSPEIAAAAIELGVDGIVAQGSDQVRKSNAGSDALHERKSSQLRVKNPAKWPALRR